MKRKSKTKELSKAEQVNFDAKMALFLRLLEESILRPGGCAITRHVNYEKRRKKFEKLMRQELGPSWEDHLLVDSLEGGVDILTSTLVSGHLLGSIPSHG